MFVSTAVVLAVNALIARQTLGGGFESFLQQQDQARIVESIPRIEALYRQLGSWEQLRSNPRPLLNLLRKDSDGQAKPSGPGDRPRRPGRRPDGNQPPPRRSQGPDRGDRGRPPPGPGGSGPERLPQSFQQRIVLVDANGAPVIGNPKNVDAATIEIFDQGQIVGRIGASRPRGPLAPNQQAFLDRQLVASGWTLVLGLTLAGLFAALLARHLSRPVSRVSDAIHALANGDFEHRIASTKAKSSDEIVRLSQDVDRLATTLAANEHARQRWTADIAHELRTPLAILQGELEAIEDGVRQPNPDAINSLREETQLLAKLVDDLHQLSLADAGALDYRMEPTDLAAQIQALEQRFAERLRRANIQLLIETPSSPVWVVADATRIQQLLNNLLENSARYTHKGGKVEIKLSEDAVTTFDDSPPGVSADECYRLFERFFRAEQSRNRKHGGSGLGLPICRKIVEAHHGQISAQPSKLGGLQIRFELPPLDQVRSKA